MKFFAAGTLWCWGDDEWGQLGDGGNQPERSPVQVGAATDWLTLDAGTHHTCAVRASGEVHCWGRNARGELGLAAWVTTPEGIADR